MVVKEKKRPDWNQLFHEALTEPGRVADCYSVFHEYSLGNNVLLMMQFRERGVSPAPVATLKRWREKFGRTVVRGSKAFQMLVPVMVNRRIVEKPPEDESAPVPDEDLTPPVDGGVRFESIDENGQPPSEGKQNDKFMVFVLKNNWFSLDQTDGKPFENKLLADEWNGMVALQRIGITKVPFDSLDGNMQGFARPKKQEIAINPLAVKPFKTLFHEMAHCLLHRDEELMVDGANLNRAEKEAEAEAVAYLCCVTLGLYEDSMDESRNYIQTWLDTQENADAFAKKSASRVFSVADKLLKAGYEEKPKPELEEGLEEDKPKKTSSPGMGM